MFFRQIAPAIFILALAIPCTAQTLTLTENDYKRAETLLGYNANPLVLHSPARPVWLPDDRFWYRLTTERGTEFVLVDPARRARMPAFDQPKLAAALSSAIGTNYEPFSLPFAQFTFEDGDRAISFDIGNRRWKCDTEGSKCASANRNGVADSVLSPDGKRAAFIRDFNLWVRDVVSGKETQLTKDGMKDFGYATNNAGWTRSNRPVLLWSPDSRKIATFQHDSRGAGEMYLVHTAVGHPTLEAWKYPLPGDDKIFQIERVVIDVDNARVIRLRMPPDPHRSSLCDHVECEGPFADVEWSADSQQLAFISSSRDHKRATLRVADAVKGTVRDVIDEKVTTYFEGGTNRPNWRFLPRPMRSFGSRNVTIGAISTSMISRPETSRIRSPEGRVTFRKPCGWTRQIGLSIFSRSEKRKDAIHTSLISTASDWTGKTSPCLHRKTRRTTCRCLLPDVSSSIGIPSRMYL